MRLDLDLEHIDPLAASRHPFETYLLALAAISGLPLIIGEPTSGTIDEALPYPLVLVWGLMLLVGSTIALVGLYWRGRSATGLVLERAGLIGVGGASLVYATALVILVQFEGAFSSCITAGFGLACFTQARRISMRIQMVLDQMRELP